MNRFEQSKKVILSHQDVSGAFIASPTFDHYKYGWLRDGTFTAYSMDLAGEQHSAERFYRWAARTIEQYRTKAEQAIQIPSRDHLLHARYTVDGYEVEGEWGTYQLDGYGTWLWGLNQHISKWQNETMKNELFPTANLITDYLLNTWSLPNFDCWEENGEMVHPSTIAAVYGGLQAIKYWFDDQRKQRIEKELRRMKNYVLEHCVKNNAICKSNQIDQPDASLLWLHFPFQMFDPQDPIFQQTVTNIESQLLTVGGVHRYPKDVYYGGGQWILLTAWLGCHYAETRQLQKAKELLKWVEAQFTDEGYLPEQVTYHLLAPDHYAEWIKKWGSPACPLLWSHAMHIILLERLEKAKKKEEQ
ncbi:glycoside hydrolase family 15 protein [Ammoniphilus resinae]|uniref:GH15 family glucan-1,4-alpha-glucosidase n=1 Tax=Ammoniphilus resinae TaxID=861532 RepID=A0ABS4GIT0_9BACL|nr:glycoside hydrolase family 15 protein [Ammoniphilus resinae]MBP1930168.1 GH15 family glucan-1,4-alpha-glucosidase [Ammoniphilus resinae]